MYKIFLYIATQLQKYRKFIKLVLWNKYLLESILIPEKLILFDFVFKQLGHPGKNIDSTSKNNKNIWNK